MSVERVGVAKTYKLFVGGEFVRSESGRSYPVHGAGGELLAHAVRASRKDLRDAVVAARTAWSAWAGATAYNRGQVLYRVAEIMESRRESLAGEVARATGCPAASAAAEVDAAIDLWVHYAGWTDKVAQVWGGLNPVAGPYFNISAPEPVGVVGVVTPATPVLVGLVARVAPILCGGNTLVALASEPHPLASVALAECLATSDVPPGVVNVLTGRGDELVPVLAAHGDVDAIDVAGVPAAGRAPVEEAAAANVKRVVDGGTTAGLYSVLPFLEVKTVWHPKGV